MLAMNYRGPYRIRTSRKPFPEIEHPMDAIIRVTRSCICESDLHIYHSMVPDTRVGSTFGHEFTGIVEEVGTLILADRVNMIEGIVDDIHHGHLPNIFSELGWGAIWKHDKKLFAKKAGTALFFAGVVTYLLLRKSKK